MFINHRLVRRTPLGRRCWVAMAPQRSPIECQLCDVSETGAKIAGQLNIELPQELELLLTKNGNIRRRCAVVWQMQDELGVRFPDHKRRRGAT